MAEQRELNIEKKEQNELISSLIEKPFIIRWIFSGSNIRVFIKLLILVSSIWLIGLCVSLYDGSALIEDGEGSFNYTSDNAVISDTFFIGDKYFVLNAHLLTRNFVNINCYITNYFPRKHYNNTHVDSINTIMRLVKNNESIYYSTYSTVNSGREYILRLTRNDDIVNLKVEVNGFGYLDDYPQILYMLGLLLSLYLFKLLLDKYLYAFTGKKFNSHSDILSWNKKHGLLRILNFDDASFLNYKYLVRKSILRIQINSEHSTKWFASYWVIFFAITLVLSLRHILFNLGDDASWNFANDMYSKSYWYNQIKDILLLGVFIPPILYKLFLVFINSIKISKYLDTNELYKIEILAEDSAGGLSPLGEITLYQFYMFILFFPFVYFSAYVLGFPVLSQTILPLYLIFTFCLFFLPLSTPHNSMLKAKIKYLDSVAAYYNKLNFEFEEFLKQGSSSEVNNKIKEMNKVHNLYLERKKLHVWPYDLEIFVKFGAVFLSNLLLYLSQYIIEFLK